MIVFFLIRLIKMILMATVSVIIWSHHPNQEPKSPDIDGYVARKATQKRSAQKDELLILEAVMN